MLVWEKKQADRCYRVTKAGGSIRLYTNGVFHSQYNPARPVAGNLWDLLLLPVFMHPEPRAINRVLVLGVGGGAIIQQLYEFLQPRQLIGVDLDKTHLYVARRFFNVKQPSVTLVHAEARSWLQAYEGEPFDLIVEDLFMEANAAGQPADPVRAIAADSAWFRLLRRNLARRGVLVMNFESRRHLLRSSYRQFMKGRGGFSGAYAFAAAHYENAIAAFLRTSLPVGQFSRKLREIKALDQRRKSCRLQFSYGKLPVE